MAEVSHLSRPHQAKRRSPWPSPGVDPARACRVATPSTATASSLTPPVGLIGRAARWSARRASSSRRTRSEGAARSTSARPASGTSHARSRALQTTVVARGRPVGGPAHQRRFRRHRLDEAVARLTVHRGFPVGEDANGGLLVPEPVDVGRTPRSVEPTDRQLVTERTAPASLRTKRNRQAVPSTSTRPSRQAILTPSMTTTPWAPGPAGRPAVDAYRAPTQRAAAPRWSSSDHNSGGKSSSGAHHQSISPVAVTNASERPLPSNRCPPIGGPGRAPPSPTARAGVDPHVGRLHHSRPHHLKTVEEANGLHAADNLGGRRPT